MVVKNRIDQQRWLHLYTKEQIEILSDLYDGVEKYSGVYEKEGTIPLESPLPEEKERLFQNVYFESFYKRWLHYFSEQFSFRLSDIGDVQLINSLVEAYQIFLCEKLQEYSIRTLIFELNYAKKQNQLSGFTPEEEYRFYNEQMLTDDKYWRSLRQSYPELFSRIHSFIERTIENGVKFAARFQRDRQELGIGNGTIGFRVGGADFHNGGQTTIQVLTNGKVAWIYKPHVLKNEVAYQEISSQIMAACGLETITYRVVERDDYGWSQFVLRKTCMNDREMHRFYQRLGIHLLCAYLFSSGDLHRENLIASGEYPVIIDHEFLFGNIHEASGITTEDAVQAFLRNSVLTTGILPSFIWEQEGKAVNTSPISDEEEIETTIWGPIIAEGGTSNMHIEYKKQRIVGNAHMATLKGCKMPAFLYREDLIEGFERAYCYVATHSEEMIKWIELHKNNVCRVIRRHTQQYAMYVRDSFHPRYLMEHTDRQIMLSGIWLGDYERNDWFREIGESEVASMLQGDIPIFYMKPVSCDLLLSNGRVLPSYFRETAVNRIKRKLLGMNQKDFERQCMLIRMSYELLSQKEKSVCDRAAQRDGCIIEKAIRKIAQTLCCTYIKSTEGKHGGWVTLSYLGQAENTWRITATDMSLYNGLPGINLFFHAYLLWEENEGVSRICKEVDQRLFEYTRQCAEKGSKNPYSGIFAGEASLVYYYELVWYMTKNRAYLQKAKEHAKVLEVHAQQPCTEDLIYGGSGAIIALIYLYQVLEDAEYLNIAEVFATQIMKQAKTDGEGIWWDTNRTGGLAGMAHGNSGAGLAFAMLATESHERAYEYSRIEQMIRSYENRFFSREKGNWVDMRTVEDGKSLESGLEHISWCHGAVGIALERHMLQSLLGEGAEDEKAAIKKVKESAWKEQNCLCHGNAGKLVILELLEQDNHSGEWEHLAQLVMEEQILKDEWYNPGLMTGIAGIGYALLLSVQKEKTLGFKWAKGQNA